MSDVLHLAPLSPMPPLKMEPGARCTEQGVLGLPHHSVIHQPISLNTSHHQMVGSSPLYLQTLPVAQHPVTQHLQLLHPAPPSPINSVPR